MSGITYLDKAELNQEYIVKKIESNSEKFKNYGIYEGSPIVPLFRSMGKNICAYKTQYGVFALRNTTAEKIRVQNARG
jgi:Fe2+ transport system protein FeoA